MSPCVCVCNCNRNLWISAAVEALSRKLLCALIEGIRMPRARLGFAHEASLVTSVQERCSQLHVRQRAHWCVDLCYSVDC